MASLKHNHKSVGGRTVDTVIATSSSAGTVEKNLTTGETSGCFSYNCQKYHNIYYPSVMVTSSFTLSNITVSKKCQ